MANIDWQDRTRLLIGDNGLEKLRLSNVIVVGLGGVGGYVVEALVRAGVGHLTLVDGDVFALSNLNRQILATQSTIGKSKAEVAEQRAKQINPNIKTEAKHLYLTKENISDFQLEKFDVIIDAVDDVDAKVEIACVAQKLGKKAISCMGTGNKLQPFFKVADVFKTTNCPLARVMRKKLKERGVKKLDVVYSEELPVETSSTVIGSISYAPAVAGLTVAYRAVQYIIDN